MKQATGRKTIYLFLSLLVLFGGCARLSSDETGSPSVTPSITLTSTSLSLTVTHTATPMPPSVTSTASLTPTASNTPAPSEPVGCQEPPDDYTRVQLPNATLNARTLAMLQHAAELYQGEIDILNAITQGSYTDTEAASFGTHAGGGAVDLSVMRSGTYTILWDEIDPLIEALRTAGFAAWLRDLDELYPGSPIHIHAIAIGDRELSYAAQMQLYAEYGYFNGMNGLPHAAGETPAPDPHGEPILCEWMQANEN